MQFHASFSSMYKSPQQENMKALLKFMTPKGTLIFIWPLNFYEIHVYKTSLRRVFDINKEHYSLPGYSIILLLSMCGFELIIG